MATRITCDLFSDQSIFRSRSQRHSHISDTTNMKNYQICSAITLIQEYLMFYLIYRMSQSQSLVTSQSVGHSRSRCHISVAFALLGRLHCIIQPSSSKNASFSVNIKFHQYNQACNIYSWEIALIYRLLDRIGRSSLPYLIAKASDQLLKLSTSLFRPYVLQRLCRIKSESEGTAFT